MKCCNLAAFDPALQRRGIKGLSKGAELDREVWQSFERDPEAVGFESEASYARITDRPLRQVDRLEWGDVEGLDREAVTKVRVNQRLFRSIILTGYREECAVCRLPIRCLLVASHIVPWAADPGNRMNPRNGICFCSLHDRAYEAGIMLIDPDLVIRLPQSAQSYRTLYIFTQSFVAFEGSQIALPDRWHPDPVLLERRRAMASEHAAEPVQGWLDSANASA
jgi:putative restriction endonuclease